MKKFIMLNVILKKLKDNQINGLNSIQTGFLTGVLTRAIKSQQNLQDVKGIVEKMSNDKLSEILYQSDEVVIYKVYVNCDDNDWTKKISHQIYLSK